LGNLLRKQGHEVTVFAMQYPENIDVPSKKYFPSEISFSGKKIRIESLLRPFGTREVRRQFNRLLNDFEPDLVHLNNIHTQLSLVVAEIAHKRGIKVVWTVHDYKLLCPRYDCLRQGQNICERCFTDKKQVIINKCMKNAWAESILAFLESKKWSRERLEKNTDFFICPSQFMADKMHQGGFDRYKLIKINNFIDTDKIQEKNSEKSDYYCYIGRLSHEKGVETLIEAAKKLPYRLVIIGSGVLKEKMEQLSVGANIEFTGHKPWSEIKEIVGKAKFSVIPSEWYENNPLSLIESLCLGTPVLGANIGGIPELMDEGQNGLLFESKNETDLREKIETMFATTFDYRSIAEKARSRHSFAHYYAAIMAVYQA
jgi:glycosyltransferase involved in cell wall biosynthesis